MPETPLTPEQRARDEQVRRNIELAFGFGGLDEDEEDAVTPAPGGADPSSPIPTPVQVLQSRRRHDM